MLLKIIHYYSTTIKYFPNQNKLSELYYYVTGDHGNGPRDVQVPRNQRRLQRQDLLEEDAVIVSCDVTIEEEVEE